MILYDRIRQAVIPSCHAVVTLAFSNSLTENSDLLRCDAAWMRYCFPTLRKSGVDSSSEVEVYKNTPQPRVRGSHLWRPKPSATLPCSYLPNASLWCMFIIYFFTPFFSQLFILYSHLSTNRMDGGEGRVGLAEDSDKWKVILHTVINCRVPQSRNSRTS